MSGKKSFITILGPNNYDKRSCDNWSDAISRSYPSRHVAQSVLRKLCASIVIHCSHVHSIVKRLNTQEHHNNMTVY